MSVAASSPVAQDPPERKGSTRALAGRLMEGDIGSLPVIAGLIIIWAIFEWLNHNFLTPRNLSNLVLQIAALGTLSVGIVPVLLLGEIDLSIGSVSGLAAGVMAVLDVKAGYPAGIAILGGLVCGCAIGLLQGFWFMRFRVPSFVVSLAGLLAWQGALLYVLGQTGTINISDPGITFLAGTFFPGWLGGTITAAVLAIFLGSLLSRRMSRLKAKLPPEPLPVVGLKFVAAVIVAGGAVAILGADRGVPLSVVILVTLVLSFDYIIRRTRFGRHVLALGGNEEASRRSGIRVSGVRVAVFTLCSTLAALGGILAASRLLAVNQSSGQGDMLLNAIASAVIGGTSLFGGRGTVWSALTGALVIGSISNGMDLLALSSSMKFMITGGVLLIAVTIDAVTRQGRLAAGRA